MAGARKVKVSSGPRTALRFAMVAVAVAFAVFAWVKIKPTHSRESLCDQAAVLKRAKLLDKAQETYAHSEDEKNECGKLGRGEVELRQAKADERFATARGYAAIKPPAGPNLNKKAAKVAAQLNSRTAVNFYLGGLTVNSFEEAARLGLSAELGKLHAPRTKVTATVRCGLAGELAKVGLLDDAGSTLSAGLRLAPKACKKALKQVNVQEAAASKHLQEALQLEDKGEVAQARDQYAAALLADGDLTAARDGLEESISDDSVLDDVGDWLAGIPATAKTVLIWLIPLAALGLVAILLLWIAIREVSARWPWLRHRLESWRRLPLLSFAANAAMPAIKVEEFDGGTDGGASGKDFSSLLEAELPRRAGREPEFPFDRAVRGTKSDVEAAASITGLLSEVSETKLLGELFALFGKLFRRRSIQLKGHLNPVTDLGVGVTLSLEGNGMKDSQVITLWEQTFDPMPGGTGAARWLRLLPAATVWARWQLAAVDNAELREGRSKRNGGWPTPSSRPASPGGPSTTPSGPRPSTRRHSKRNPSCCPPHTIWR